MKRREFIYRSAAATACAILLPNIWGCKKNNVTNTAPNFPYLEVKGSHYEVGKQIGSHFKEKIISSKAGIQEYIGMANEVVDAAPDVFYDPFLSSAQNIFPDYIDEMQGIADGTGQSLRDVFIANTFMEILYLYMELSGKKTGLNLKNLGCSTVAYSKNGKNILCHNEDLFTSFLDYMYVLKISVPGKPEIVGLSYPGLLPGIPPSMNEAGIVQCGNDISGLHIEPSVPMVFHFRSVMDSNSLSEATEKVTIPERARTMTHNIGSFNENKILSIEAGISKHQQNEVDGFYVHTNHFIQSNMLDIEIDPGTLDSSISRYDVLSSLSSEYSNKPYQVNSKLITGFLSSHDGVHAPCVHDDHGSSTLGHTVFDFNERNMKLYYSNPCLGNSIIHSDI